MRSEISESADQMRGTEYLEEADFRIEFYLSAVTYCLYLYNVLKSDIIYLISKPHITYLVFRINRCTPLSVLHYP